MMFHYCLNI